MNSGELHEYLNKIAQQAANDVQPSLLSVNENNFQIAIGNNYLHEYRLYYQLFKKIPNVYDLFRLDKEKVIGFLQKKYEKEIVQFFFKKGYNDRKKKFLYDDVYFVLKDETVIHIDEHSYGSVLHHTTETTHFEAIAQSLQAYKQKEYTKKREINLITSGEFGLDLTALEIKKTVLDLDCNYNDDIKPVHDVILKRINKKSDKGIVLLHGQPGTGKTTYLRYIINKIQKKVMFIPPDIAHRIANPGFINILINNPNSVLIIEDAENIITDRKQSDSSVASVLLNLSDGLLSDCLNVQIICTFNTELSNIDPALLRKGRLIARYEFKPLKAEKAQKLSNKLGFKTAINEDMLLSEIYNQGDMNFEKPAKSTVIGFHR